MPADQDASKCYDPTDDEYYYGYGCTIVSTGQKIPIAAEFTKSKQAPEETAMRVTEWYAQEVNMILRWAPNQGGIDSVRLDSLLQSDLHDYSIVSVITP